MGKEAIDAKSYVRVPPVTRPRSLLACLQTDWKRAWSSTTSVVLKSQLAEDGRAVVVIRSWRYEVTMVFTGLANRDNKYTTLLKSLREKGQLARRDHVASLAIFQDFVWNPVDPRHDRFQSGDRVLISIASPIRIKRRNHKPIRLPVPLAIWPSTYAYPS